MVLPTFSAWVSGCFRGGVISSRVRVFGLVLGLLNQRLIRWQLLVRGIYMHERCRHECIRMQMYALVVDEMPMLMCSKYFMRNDTYAVDESLYMYVLGGKSSFVNKNMHLSSGSSTNSNGTKLLWQADTSYPKLLSKFQLNWSYNYFIKIPASYQPYTSSEFL